MQTKDEKLQSNPKLLSEIEPLRNCDQDGNITCKILEQEQLSSGPKFGKRHVQVLIYCMLLVVVVWMRISLSIGIVAMTNSATSINPNVPTYNWTYKSVVLASFYWGYVLPQIGAGWLADHYGPKWILVCSTAVDSLCGVMIPVLAAAYGYQGVIAARIVQGVCQGFVYPSLHNLLSKWAPLSERSRLGAFVYSGAAFGIVLSMLLGGFISASWYGWPMVFYCAGAAEVVVCLIFIYFGCNGPEHHSTITIEEKYFIANNSGHNKNDSKPNTPWMKIFSSKPVWAIFFGQAAYNWIVYALTTETPTYMASVMKFNTQSNSLVSALPYLSKWMLSFVFSYITDMMTNKKIVSTGTIRKIMTCIGLLVPAAALITIGNAGPEEGIKVVVLLFIGISFMSAIYSAFNVNHMDLSPNYAGVLMGMINSSASGIGMFAPLCVQYVVTDENNPNQWRVIFYLSAGISVFCSTIFLVFASGEIQPWNNWHNEEAMTGWL